MHWAKNTFSNGISKIENETSLKHESIHITTDLQSFAPEVFFTENCKHEKSMKTIVSDRLYKYLFLIFLLVYKTNILIMARRKC